MRTFAGLVVKIFQFFKWQTPRKFEVILDFRTCMTEMKGVWYCVCGRHNSWNKDILKCSQ